MVNYTHYFGPKPSSLSTATLERQYQRALKRCGQIIRHYTIEHGELSGTSGASLQGLTVNGVGSEAHDDFTLRPQWSQNDLDFCMTAGKSYDIAVVACLIVVHYYMGPKAFGVTSEGTTRDWQAGLRLAQKVTGLRMLTIPDSIRYQAPERLRLVR